MGWQNGVSCNFPDTTRVRLGHWAEEGCSEGRILPEDAIESDETDANAVGEVIQGKVMHIPVEAMVDGENGTKSEKRPRHQYPQQPKVYVKKVAATKKNVFKKVQPTSDVSNFNDSVDSIEEEAQTTSRRW